MIMGVEEGNTLDHNLASLVHILGWHASQSNSSGQYMGAVAASPQLTLPADVAASGFYITNPYNAIVGNAASGGWAGFDLPVLWAGVFSSISNDGTAVACLSVTCPRA